jgi:hypothetical protein
MYNKRSLTSFYTGKIKALLPNIIPTTYAWLSTLLAPIGSLA